jgi:hypothetical protein
MNQIVSKALQCKHAYMVLATRLISETEVQQQATNQHNTILSIKKTHHTSKYSYHHDCLVNSSTTETAITFHLET